MCSVPCAHSGYHTRRFLLVPSMPDDLFHAEARSAAHAPTAPAAGVALESVAELSLAIMAVGFAPFAEEYLFRGLLFRALDREWGGWRAVQGSAAFFAIYHPALVWFPVAMLGTANALLFKKSGRFGPAVALHMVYNAVVLRFHLDQWHALQALRNSRYYFTHDLQRFPTLL
jgi:membrane protease YdiL (CAAX protease family)